MSKIDLDPITSGYNLSKINANFQKVEDELNNKVLYRDSPAGEPNSMSSNLDMNSRSILNANKISSNILELGGVQVAPTNLATDPYNGTREALRRSYAEAGYNLVDGSFEAGGTLVNANDVLLQEQTGKAFSGPAGTVAAGTNPTGGGFVDISSRLTVVGATTETIASTAYPVGTEIMVADRLDARFIVQSGGVADGYSIISVAGGNTAKLVKNGEAHVEWYGAKPAPFDSSNHFNAALQDCRIVRAVNGPYKIGNVTIPYGSKLLGRKGFTVDKNAGNVLIPTSNTGFMVNVGVGCAFSGFLMYEPNQFLAFTSDYLNESFNTTSVPICTNTTANSFISDMVVVGFNSIIKRMDTTASGGVSSTSIKSLRGFATDSAIDINRSLDVFRCDDVHLNPSIFNSIYGANTSTQYLMTKLALSAVVFRFARVDDCQIDNSFAYGIKRFIEVNPTSYVGDTSSGGGITASNCGADVCSQFMYLRRSDTPFGYKFINCWCAPVVKPLDGTAQASILVGNGVAVCEANEIHLSNFTQFGTPTVPQIVPAHQALANHLFKFSASSQYNRALFSNVTAIDLSGAPYLNDGVKTGSLRNTYHGGEIIIATPGDLAIKSVTGENVLSFNNGAIRTYGIHNNTLNLNTTEGVGSGTFTTQPGTQANVNVTSTNLTSQCTWAKVGSVVSVSGLIAVVPTADGVLTQVYIKPPIPFSAGAGAGTGASFGKINAVHVEKVTGDIRISFKSEGTGTHNISYSYMYTLA